ncbi:hypothetical protein [Streptomyces sp. BE230]|uniref:hypothetical protein n=1 Tax=Streptomyces sp. BE230 TaxID=3002526 RepID=UPI002ED2A925|nr:hypothetical protein [Streptomyces sp. BE230]
MDPIVTAAASVLVRAMSSDAWQQVQAEMVALWRRALPGRAEDVEASLADARAEVLAGRDSGDEAIEAELAADWQLRIRRLLETEPALADDLTQFVNDSLATLPPDERARINRVVVEATGSGDARVYQAGRDMHITGHGREGSEVGNTPPGPPLGDDDDEW